MSPIAATSEGASQPKSGPALHEVIPAIENRFEPGAALGILCIDAAPLESIELGYGHEAHSRVLATLRDRIQGVNVEAFGGQAEVVLAELGRREVLVLLVRETGGAELFSRDLPAFAQLIHQMLERNSQKIAYPYCRELPKLQVGYALNLRNPKLGCTTQIRQTIEQAREDAGLNQQIYARERRREFLGVLLEGRVRSVYEPIVCAKSLTVFGYEALARGPAETEFGSAFGLFSAGAEHRMLYELDCLCRTAALEGARDFPAGTKLFINIRPTAIHDPRFQPAVLIETLARAKLSPTDVVFEISEQESIENYDVFREARDAYGNLGFQFALDDTGAGYASLESVMELSPEFIKVDRAFVRGIDEDPGRQAMVRGFQEVAESVGARIIGEGLDRLEELQKLAELNIDFGQGWLFGKPTPLRAQRGTGAAPA